MLGFEQIVELTHDEARDEILELLDQVGFPATSWQEFSIPRTLTDIGAYIWSNTTKIAVAIKEAGFNETASGIGLDILSLSHYQNVRFKAVAEVHRVTLTCEAGEGPHTINPGDFSAKNNAGVSFTNIIDDISASGPKYPAEYPLVIAPGQSVQILLKADTPGEESVTELGDLNTIITTLSGVTMTDDAVVIVGAAVEADPRLRLRNSLKWALLPAVGMIDDTILALAFSRPQIDRIRIDSNNPRGAGTLDVYLTAAQGNVGDADELAVKTAIQRRMLHDPDETALQIKHAKLQALDIAGDIYLKPGFLWEEDVLPAIEADLEAWRRTIPLGGMPYPDPGSIVPINEIEQVIRRVNIGGSEPVLTVKLTSPTADVPVESYAHVTRGTWTFTDIVVGEA